MSRAYLIVAAILTGLSVPPIVVARRALQGLEGLIPAGTPLRWLAQGFLTLSPAWPFAAGATALLAVLLTVLNVNSRTRAVTAFAITAALFCVTVFSLMAFALPLDASLSRTSTK
jgi:hypothetical protein